MPQTVDAYMPSHRPVDGSYAVAGPQGVESRYVAEANQPLGVGAQRHLWTLTAPNCPAADFIMEDVRLKLDGIDGIKEAKVNLVFEPEWDKDMMSDEAKLELGFM